MASQSFRDWIHVWSAGGRRRSANTGSSEAPADDVGKLDRDLADPYRELDRHKRVVLEAIHHLSRSRCATQSAHVQAAKNLLETLVEKSDLRKDH